LEEGPGNGQDGILPGVESSGSSETVEMVGEEHEGGGLTIVGGGIPREIEAERVVSNGGYELINLSEHDCDGSGAKLRRSVYAIDYLISTYNPSRLAQLSLPSNQLG